MLKDHKHIIYLGVLKQLLGGHRFRCSEEVEMLVNARALFLP